MSETPQSPTQDPSLIAGNTTSDYAAELGAMMERVVPIFELDDAAFAPAAKAYIDARVDELSPLASETTVGAAHGGTSKFIGPNTLMLGASLFSKGYYLDDNEAYEPAVGYTRSIYNSASARMAPARAYVFSALRGVNYGQAIYFDSIIGNPNASSRVSADIIDDDLPESEASIRDFKYVAMCQERAGVAHNSLLILGIRSRLERGTISVVNEDGSIDSESHAFLTVERDDGSRYIFDPTNPIMTRNEDGLISDIKPALYKIDSPHTTTITGTLKGYAKTADSLQETRSRQVTYEIR